MEFMNKTVAFFKKIFSNYYFTFLLCFAIWMLFFDDNDVFSRYKLWRKMKDVENEKKTFEENIVKVKKERDEVLGNDAAIEKFAREEQLMKKPTEEIFIIKKKE